MINNQKTVYIILILMISNIFTSCSNPEFYSDKSIGKDLDVNLIESQIEKLKEIDPVLKSKLAYYTLNHKFLGVLSYTTMLPGININKLENPNYKLIWGTSCYTSTDLNNLAWIYAYKYNINLLSLKNKEDLILPLTSYEKSIFEMYETIVE